MHGYGLAQVGNGLFGVALGVVADFEFFQTYGSGSAARMQTIVNEIDALFRDDVGATFRVTESVVFETVDDPFGEFTTGDTFADYEAATEEFGDYRAGVGGPRARSRARAQAASSAEVRTPRGSKCVRLAAQPAARSAATTASTRTSKARRCSPGARTSSPTGRGSGASSG